MKVHPVVFFAGLFAVLYYARKRIPEGEIGDVEVIDWNPDPLEDEWL